MIFIIFEEVNKIKKRIWPQKSNIVSEKSKITHYKNLIQKILTTKPEFYSIITQNDRKAITHFEKSIKNQLFQFKKRYKEACTNLRVTSQRLPNKDAIWPKEKICNK